MMRPWLWSFRKRWIAFERKIIDWERRVFLSEEFDRASAILSVHPGAGERSPKIGHICSLGCI